MNLEFIYVSEPAELSACAYEISSSPRLAIDLEFDKNRYAYGFNLSLIQIYTGENIYLIDGLTGLDLSPVFSALQNPDIEKVVFAFGEDLRLLHSLNCFPKNVYDLDINAKLLDFEPCSLSKLCFLQLGVEEKKSSQKSNWLIRPLTEEQKLYAAEDVIHLFDLQVSLKSHKNAHLVQEWIDEENAGVDHLDYSELQDFSPIKNKDIKELTEYDLYVLEQLMEIREGIAKRTNKPGYQLAPKDELIALASGKMPLKVFLSKKRISSRLKTSEVKSSLHNLLVTSPSTAKELGISKDNPAIPKLSKEEYELHKARKRTTDKIMDKLLLPIKNDLKPDIGENAASFVFSNKIMMEIAIKGVSHLMNYKQQIIKKKVAKLSLDSSILRKE